MHTQKNASTIVEDVVILCEMMEANPVSGCTRGDGMAWHGMAWHGVAWRGMEMRARGSGMAREEVLLHMYVSTRVHACAYACACLQTWVLYGGIIDQTLVSAQDLQRLKT